MRGETIEFPELDLRQNGSVDPHPPPLVISPAAPTRAGPARTVAIGPGLLLEWRRKGFAWHARVVAWRSRVGTPAPVDVPSLGIAAKSLRMSGAVVDGWRT